MIPRLSFVIQHIANKQSLSMIFFSLIIITGCTPHSSVALKHSEQSTRQKTSNSFPESISDPFEPVNRRIDKVNEKLVLGAIRPTTKIYRTITPLKARQSITHFSRNITYPVRLVNNTLQGRWKGAGDESLRFLTNSTVGIGGLFDPSTHWNIPKSEANSSQTLNKWGWQPHNYVTLPLLGPSDDLHIAGRVGDSALKPWSYINNLSFVSGGITFNNLSGKTESLARLIQTKTDSYEDLKYFWTYSSKKHTPDWSLSAPRDYSSLQTLSVAALQYDDPEFAIKGKQSNIRLSSTDKKMKFNYWLQKQKAPLVYIVPGVGAHRLSPITTVLAENLYQNGYSVVTTVGTFHPEFMENAATTAIPAYPPVDCLDMLIQLTEINTFLENKHSERFSSRVLLGASLGGFQSLYIAANEDNIPPELLKFDRYIAINPPVDLNYGNKQLDNYFEAPLRWPADKRQEKINNAIHKAVSFPFLTDEQLKNPPFDGIESQYIIGLSFRSALRDAIFSSQSRHNLGLIKTPLNKWRRKAAYDEINGYSFEDYLTAFVLPYYKEQGVSRAKFEREVDLKTNQKNLHTNQKTRVFTNVDDFILGAKNVSWLRSTFDSSRLTLLPNGGHLGNIASPAVEEATLKSLEGL